MEGTPTLFDELAAILKFSRFEAALVRSGNKVRGIRRMDTALYTIKGDHTSVELWAERRLGNPTIFIMVIPAPRFMWRRDSLSDQLAERIADLLIEHGAIAI